MHEISPHLSRAPLFGGGQDLLGLITLVTGNLPIVGSCWQCAFFKPHVLQSAYSGARRPKLFQMDRKS
jgi:hypothetical protein